VESVVLGRAAMGETVRNASVVDSWRIRRGGRLVFADTTRLRGEVDRAMAGGATAKGGAAFATISLVGPEAESLLGSAREALQDAPGEGGASAWNGMLVARIVAPGGQALRATMIRLIEALRGRPMPRVWSC
jgi:urease accessory protein